MENVDLPALFATGEFADCTFVSASGEEFSAHRIVISQYPRLMEQVVAQNRRVQLAESTEVVERMLRWMYEADWEPIDFQPTRKGMGRELGYIGELIDAARKYELPKLAEESYSNIGRVIANISNAEGGLRILRDLTEARSSQGALQRTVIDRVLGLVTKTLVHRPGSSKRKHADEKDNDPPILRGEEDNDSDADSVPKRSERAKKPTEKAKEPLPKARKKSILAQQAHKTQKLHCVCQKPEDAFLVQCEGCKRWWHPGCIGKGKYAQSTYKSARKFALAGDEKMFRESDRNFRCTECDGKA